MRKRDNTAPKPKNTSPNTPVTIPPTRFSFGDMIREAFAGLVQRPGRTVLTMIGPVLGIGAFIAVMGLTATTNGQISSDFSALTATQLTVTDAGTPDSNETVYSFPKNADNIIDHLNGVESAGVSWSLPVSTPTVSTSFDPRVNPSTVPVSAATPGYFTAANARFSAGVPISTFENQHNLRVAVLGAAAARQLGIASIDDQPAIVINGVAFTVIGIMNSASRDPGILGTILIPAATGQQIWGNPTFTTPATMLISTRLGAAPLIARQAALALRPDAPTTLKVTPPPPPSLVQGSVTASLASLFLALAAVVLFIGAVGIANTTLVAVIERTPEIGLRRSLGARPRDITTQFLTESAAIGAIGGLIGAALGTFVVVAVALAHDWTAVMNPWITITGTPLGALIGLLAGIYPAVRASHTQPLNALRH